MSINIKTDTDNLITCPECDGTSLLKVVKASKYWVVAVNVGARRLDLTIESTLLDDLSTDHLQIYLLNNEFKFKYDPYSGRVEEIDIIVNQGILNDEN